MEHTKKKGITMDKFIMSDKKEIEKIKKELCHPKSERVLRCQMVLQVGGYPEKELNNATIEALLEQKNNKKNKKEKLDFLNLI
jgi:hypothetical protein